jgi:hypothetical protein
LKQKDFASQHDYEEAHTHGHIVNNTRVTDSLSALLAETPKLRASYKAR